MHKTFILVPPEENIPLHAASPSPQLSTLDRSIDPEAHGGGDQREGCQRLPPVALDHPVAVASAIEAADSAAGFQKEDVKSSAWVRSKGKLWLLRNHRKESNGDLKCPWGPQSPFCKRIPGLLRVAPKILEKRRWRAREGGRTLKAQQGCYISAKTCPTPFFAELGWKR